MDTMSCCGMKIASNPFNRGPVTVSREMQKLRYLINGKLYVRSRKAKVL